MMTAHHCGPDCLHSQRGEAIQIALTVAEQRRLAEHEAGGPCFRMWMTEHEFKQAAFADWTAYPIGSGYMAVWRKQTDLDSLLAGNSDERYIGFEIQKRILPDIDGEPPGYFKTELK